MPRFDCMGPTCRSKFQQGLNEQELKKHPFNSSTFLFAKTDEELDKQIDLCGWAEYPSYGKICAKCSRYLRRDAR